MPHHQHEARGVWSVGEHERFLEAMTLYPRGPWRLITKHVGTRSIKQVQTHAQKYQQKLLRHQRGLRKRKTRVKRPEHRVDEQTFDQFTNGCIVRHQQRAGSVASDDEQASSTSRSPPSSAASTVSDTTSESETSTTEVPDSPLSFISPDSPTSVGMSSLAGKTLDDWEFDSLQLGQTIATSTGNSKSKDQDRALPSLIDEIAPLDACMLLPEWSDWHMDDFFKPFENLPCCKAEEGDASSLPSWSEVQDLTV